MEQAIKELYSARKVLTDKMSTINMDYKHREDFLLILQDQINDIDKQVELILVSEESRKESGRIPDHLLLTKHKGIW